MIQDHYLSEDLDLLSDELFNLHGNCMNILKSATDADFTRTDDHLIQIQKSLKVIMALHRKKLQRDQFDAINYGIYARRGWHDGKKS